MRHFDQAKHTESTQRSEPDWDLRPPPVGGVDFTPFVGGLEALRRTVPVEVQQQLTAFLREGLLTVRTLIDWYLERLDSQEQGRSVEDIPIE